MECLQKRKDSFAPPKSKRSKGSSSKAASSSKWPHPSSFKATPETLAEAGFYLSDPPDFVTCFMCKKELGGWEEEDDPFEIHFDRCRDKCAWAVVRCQRGIGDENYEFSDPARHPTSKIMEKARLDTFSVHRWPHDRVKGHGASSKALARAGFVCNPIEPGDDNATCLYCNTSLGGWDENDDPYEEHMKRSQKKETTCAFLVAFADKRPMHNAIAKSSRTTSRTIAHVDADTAGRSSEDELAADALSDITSLPTTSSGRPSRASSARVSSVAAKTPGSRRSTRGASKTPGSKTISSEADETDAGSESEVGKRTKPKRKTNGRTTKARVSAIVEEEEAEPPMSEQEEMEDIEMQTQEQEQELPGKNKRVRPPKNASKPVSKTRSKRGEPKEENEAVAEMDVDSAPSTSAKKGHNRTRSKVTLEPEATAQSSSKGTSKRTKPGAKVAKQGSEEEADPEPLPPKKMRAAPRKVEVEDDVVSPRPSAAPKPKGRTASRSKAKTKRQESDLDDDAQVHPSPHDQAEDQRNAQPHPSRASDERKSSLSEDAGYATAEPPPDADNMDVDKADISHAQQSGANPISSKVIKQPSPSLNGVRSSSAAPSSRASSSRPPSKLNKQSLKVIEIDSDGEEANQATLPPNPLITKGKAPMARVPSMTSLKMVRKPSSETSKRKLQVEVVKPPAVCPPTLPPADVHMQDQSPSRPPTDLNPVASVAIVAGTPISAVHRSAPVSPAHIETDDHDARNPDVKVPTTVSSSTDVYHPFLAQFPIEQLTSLTEEETEMTLEQYIRREMELQYTQLRADAERRIEEFKQKAAETRRIIEAA